MAIKMSVIRNQGIPFSGVLSGFNGCPFNMDTILEKYSEGAQTPNKIIYFEGLTTDITITTVPIDTVAESNGEQSIDLVACSCSFETSTQNFRTPNIHKGGSARASEFWGVIPTNIVSCKLLKQLHSGSIPKIVVSNLTFLNEQGEEKAKVIQTEVYGSCFITHVDMTSYDSLTLFSFSFVNVEITRHDYRIKSPHDRSGQYVYSFDYAKPLGSGK